MKPFHDPQAVKNVWAQIHGQTGNIMGPHNRQNRQRLMLAITGEKRPVSKCGVTAIESEIWSALGITHGCGCDAARDRIASEMIAAL